MNDYTCPLFASCNAPICPLDQDISKRAYKHGEAICYYMNEYAKPDSYIRFKSCHREEIYESISLVIKEVESTHGYIKQRLERASQTPSRMHKSKIKFN